MREVNVMVTVVVDGILVLGSLDLVLMHVQVMAGPTLDSALNSVAILEGTQSIVLMV